MGYKKHDPALHAADLHPLADETRILPSPRASFPEPKTSLSYDIGTIPERPTARTRIGQARVHLAQGRLSAARKVARQLLRKSPSNKSAHLLKIDAAKAEGDLDKMLRCCRIALRHHPDDRTFLKRHVYALMQSARPQKALAVLERLCAEEPGDVSLMIRKAGACRAVGKVKTARQILDQAPQTNPVILAQANLEEQEGNRTLALERLAKIVEPPAEKVGKSDLAVVLKFCSLCLLTGQAERGRRALNDAAIKPQTLSPVDLERTLHLALKLGANDLAAAALGAAFSTDVISLSLAVYILRTVHFMGRPDVTERTRKRLEPQVFPAHRAAFRIRSDLLAMNADAATAHARATQTAQRTSAAARALAGALLQSGTYDLLLRYLAFCRRRWRSDPKFAILHAEALAEFGQPQAALDLIERTHAKNSMRMVSLKLNILYNSGRLAEASRLLRETKFDPHSLAPPKMRLFLAIGEDRMDDALEMAPDIASEISKDHSVLSRFSTTHVGAVLNEAKIYRFASRHDQVSSVVDPQSLDRSFFVPAKQTLDRLWPQIADSIPTTDHSQIPKQIWQYWDRVPVPDAVSETMASWRKSSGYRHCVLSRKDARDFLRTEFGSAHVKAFNMANSVTEECDFLRLCLLFAKGGVYADADDRLIGDLERLRRAGRGLLLFREPFGAIANNLMLSRPGHPLMQIAVNMALDSLLARENDSTWSKTGPGLMTRAAAIYLKGTGSEEAACDFTLLPQYLGRRVVQFHVDLPYKSTGSYWNSTKGALPSIVTQTLDRHI